MTQYEVWTTAGSYFNSFKNYGDACDLRDKLQKDYPNATIVIKEKEV